ncbi:maleylpyruvate isomerase family mycothiol-dependent enzyme [Jongsikchunia kroppenstedtii]|uniref:maleylpyruvate isomerase family mycothiol-dependent enzyme n=1 Tax=Jongsikchunia kroppenstedtii TaxID=1121721 RepID=UPI00039A93DE|nr:maleylpyruvate isomerase family mycothiol-dependent enzyme [Jongsikchunia kroppenstedtii]
MTNIGPEQWLSALRSEGDTFASVPVDALDRPVPTCPEWDVAELIRHLGGVHRWVRRTFLGTTDEPRVNQHELSGQELVDWYRPNLDAIVAELTDRDPAEPVRSFVGDATVGFWCRRQAQETAMHRYDLDTAIRPGDERPIDSALAADGIDEWLELFVPRFLGLGPGIPADMVGMTMHLHADDIDGGEWSLALTADGIDWSRAHSKADAALRAGVSDLLLAVWHRTPLSDVQVFGDQAATAKILDLVHVT